jgi:hypothetical protein
MGPLEELLAVSERRALEFFATGLKDVCEPGVDRAELFYNASVLAHYALVSTETTAGWPAPRTLAAVFDQFVQDPHAFSAPSLMEEAAAQCLLMSGFFETQMQARHNIRWYADLGAGFYARAAATSASPQRARFFEALAREFEPWRRRHARLSRELRDIPYLLHVPDQPHTM